MTVTNHSIRLPGNFVTDREERGLSCGETTTKGRQILCVMDTETLQDMASDAKHQGHDTDWDNPSGVRSARRASEILQAYIAGMKP